MSGTVHASAAALRSVGSWTNLGYGARIARLVYAAADPKTGACGSALDVASHAAMNHRFAIVSGVLAEQSAALLRDFFAARRSSARELG